MLMEKPFNSGTWLNWQQPASPFLLGPTVDACGAPFRDTFGFPFFTSVVFYRTVDAERGYHASWLLRVDEGKACGRLLHDLLAVPSFRPWFDDLLQAAFDGIADAAATVAGTPVEALSQPQLTELFDTYYAAFVDFYKLAAITEPVQWWAEESFQQYVAAAEGAGRSVAPEGWSKERIERAAFSMGEEPYTHAIERDLVAVAEAVDAVLASDADLPDPGSDEALERALASAPVCAAAAAHASRFGWKASNYREVSVLDAESVVAEVLSLGSGARSLAEGLSEHVTQAEARRRAACADRAQLLLRAPEPVRAALQIGDQYGASLADRRKATMLRALGGLDVLGRELARRASVSYADFLLLTPTEVHTFVRRPSLYAPRWELRRDALVLIGAAFPLDDAEMVAHIELANGSAPRVPRKRDVSLAEGPEGRRLLDRVDLRMGLFDHDGAPRVARGDVVTPPRGQAVFEGVCRVVTDPRRDRLVPGEILIATSTTPDFMTAIRQASAIIVDQGGVLSHAALTSRELDKPCIVGTSVATALFRTGDRIRIDFADGSAVRVEAPKDGAS